MNSHTHYNQEISNAHITYQTLEKVFEWRGSMFYLTMKSIGLCSKIFMFIECIRSEL